MFQRRPRKFRRRPNGRSNLSRNNNSSIRLRQGSFSNDYNRNKFKPSLSAEKLFEKYSSLAKEAMTSGDKTLSENYLQHADHFMRIIEEKNKFRNQNKVNFDDKKNTETNKVQEVTNSTNNDNSENSQN